MAKLHKLSNGMEILLEENHAAPVISYHLLVKVGSAMETKKEAGISHLIEHMLFKGTPSRKVGKIAKDVEAAGGEINAYTSFDQTAYYINMATKFWKDGLDILSDAIQNSLFDPAELEREKEVVLEEIRRGMDNPPNRCSELLFSNAYKKHPYKNPIIGFEHTVKSFTRDNIIDYFKKWYSPHNVTLTVVGDFSSELMLENINRAFKNFTGKPLPQYSLPQEGKPENLTLVLEENPIFATYFNIGFLIPDIRHEDVPALDILSHIMAGTDSSRLHQNIKEKKRLVNAIYSYAYTPKEPGIFIVGALTSPQKTKEAIIAIWKEIAEFYTSPITTKELNMAKSNLVANEIYEKETAGGQAGKYTYFMATAGSHDFEEKYYQTLKDVGADDIRRVAQKYLTPKNATVVIVHPKGSRAEIDPKSISAGIKKYSPSEKSIKKIRDKSSPPVVHKLKNGIRLLIRENHTLPIVACCAAVHAGLRYENKKNNGINNLLAMTILKGTKNKNALQIAEKIESISGSIDAFSGRNSFGLKSEFLSDKLDVGLNLFAEVLTEPSFTPSEISFEKQQVLDAIKHQEDQLTSLVFMKFLSSLYPNHPYGLKSLGEKQSVRALKRTDIVSYYDRIVGPKELVVTLTGDLSPDEAIKIAEEKFNFRNRPKAPFTLPKPQKSPSKPVIVEYTRPGKEQAHIIVGFLAPTLASKDHYTFAVLNNILSGQGGRLFVHLRDELSLAYAVNSSYVTGLEPGYFAVYIGTDPSKIEIATTAIMSELERLIKNGATSEELKRSKNHIIGSYQLDRQRNLGVASSYAFNLLYGLGTNEIDEFPNKIERVTKEDILRVAKKYIKLEAPVTAIVKPE